MNPVPSKEEYEYNNLTSATLTFFKLGFTPSLSSHYKAWNYKEKKKEKMEGIQEICVERTQRKKDVYQLLT